MRDPYNATKEEIINWAYDEEADHPEQDWDLVSVARFENIDLLIGLVIDDKCPKRKWALYQLYFIIGGSIQCKDSKKNLEIILEKAKSVDNTSIKKWVNRSLDLLMHPEKFSYDAWCRGYLASDLVDYSFE